MIKVLSISLLSTTLLLNANFAQSESFATDGNKTITPSEILPKGAEGQVAKDGTFVRKGTIKATIDNIAILNKMFNQPANKARYDKIDESIKPIMELVPSFYALDMFKFFTVNEWLQDENNKGRILVTLLYLDKYMNTLDKEDASKVIERLQFLQSKNLAPEITGRIASLLQKKM